MALNQGHTKAAKQQAAMQALSPDVTAGIPPPPHTETPWEPLVSALQPNHQEMTQKWL